MLFAEAWERWHTAHHVARPVILLAAVMLVLGLSHGRLHRSPARRRALTLTDEGVVPLLLSKERQLIGWLPRVRRRSDELVDALKSADIRHHGAGIGRRG